MRDGRTVAVTRRWPRSRKLRARRGACWAATSPTSRRRARPRSSGGAGTIGGELLSRRARRGRPSRARRQRSTCGAARSSASPACSAPAAPRRRARIFGADQPDARHDHASTAAERDFSDARRRDRAPASASAREDRKVEGIVPDMSVRENLTLALLPRADARRASSTRRGSARSSSASSSALGIKCAGPDQQIRELSGGNQQKVLLARWLCMNPKLLILDEPTRGIDVGAKAEIQTLIRELAERGPRRADDLVRARGDGRGRRPRLRAARRPHGGGAAARAN